MADVPDLDIDVIEGPGHAGNRAALDAWATAVREGINNPKVATASAPGAAPIWPPTVTDSRRLIFYVAEDPYYASCDGRTTTTVGTTAPGTTVIVNAAIGFIRHHGIFISGAGPAGGDYVGEVVAVNGTTLTVTPATSTSVAAGAWVAHDDTAALQAAIDAVFAAGAGTVLGPAYGLSRINGPLQDPTGANGILILPPRILQYGSIPVDICIEGSAVPAFSDQGSPDNPSSGGWIIACNKDDHEGTGAMLSGRWNDGGGWGNFTAAFLTLKNVTFRAPTGPTINGINAYDIARINMEGKVVVETGPVTALVSIVNDKYGVKFPAFNCVPASRVASLTVSSFNRGIIAHERTHISNLYTTYTKYPVESNSGTLVIDNVVSDVFTSFVRTTTGGGVKIGMAAIDQGDYVVDDASNLLTGEIAYTRGSGLMGIKGGTGVRVRRLGSDTRVAATAATNGNPIFVGQGQTSRAWYDMAVASNGDVYATVYGVGVFRQANGSGVFASYWATAKNLTGICIASDGSIYVAEYGGDIWKQTGGTGDFEELSQSSRNWKYMCINPVNGDVYAVVPNVDIFVQAGGTGNFVGLSAGGNPWNGACAAPNGDIYACIYGGDIARRAGGAGAFGLLSQTPSNWYDLGADAYGNIYAPVANDGIYMRKAGAGNFTRIYQESLAWATVAGGPDGKVYAAVSSGDIYTQMFPVLSSIPIAP